MHVIYEGIVTGISVSFVTDLIKESNMVKNLVEGVKTMGAFVKVLAQKIKNTTVAGLSLVDPLLTIGIHGIAIDGVAKALSVVGMSAVAVSMFVMDPFYLNIATWGAFGLFFVAFFRGMRASVQQQGRVLVSA